MLNREGDRQVHQPISVCSFTVSQHGEYTEQPCVFTGENCIQLFLEHLEIERRRIEDILNTVNEPIRTNAADEESYEGRRVVTYAEPIYMIEGNAGTTIIFL